MSKPCDLTRYTDFHGSPSNLEAESHFEVGLARTDGSPVSLFIFTGTAQVNIRPSSDNVTWRGVIEIPLDLQLDDSAQLVDSACYAAFAAYANTADNNPTYAIDCVDLILRGGAALPFFPVLQVAVAIEGSAGDTQITGIAYQANLQVLGIVVIPDWGDLETLALGVAGIPSADALGLKTNVVFVPNDGTHGDYDIISLSPPAGTKVVVGTVVTVMAWNRSE
jgi:hypothetical protein